MTNVTNITVPDQSGLYDKLFILGAVCLAALVLPLSFSGAVMALPAINRELQGSSVALNWVINAFMLSFGSTLMAAGALADEFGRKKIFATGLAAFALTSGIIGLSPNLLVLDLLRGMQGICAAATLAGGSAALAQEFEGAARVRAFSVLGTTFGVGLAFGPVVAGFMTQSWGWRSIFLTCTVIGTLVLVFGVPRMRESKDPQARGLDGWGTLTFTSFLAFLTTGVLEAPEKGWTNVWVLTLFSVAFLMGLLFLLIEKTVQRPMLDLSLFRYPRFVGVQILPLATCYCYIVLLVILPIRFMGIEGRSEVQTGLLMMSLSVPLLILPSIAAFLTRWVSPGLLSGLGLLLAALGLFEMARISLHQPAESFVWPMLVIGIGAGLPWGLMDGLSVSVVPKERAGMATGIFSTTRLAGEAIALALVNAILAALIHLNLNASPLSAAPSSANLSQAAQRMATGDLPHALNLLPQATTAHLITSYLEAFSDLLYLLTGITILASLFVFAFLSWPEKPDEEH